MGVVAKSLGKLDEAIKLTQKAIELDPVNDINYSNLAILYFYTSHYQEAVSALRKTLDLNPRCPAVHQLWGTVRLYQGKIDSALIITQQEPDHFWRSYGLALVHYAAGRNQEADRSLNDLIKTSRDDAPYQIASIYAHRNESNQVFRCLDRAYELRDGGASQMIGDPLLRHIQNDPRYAAFLRKLKLVE